MTHPPKMARISNNYLCPDHDTRSDREGSETEDGTITVKISEVALHEISNWNDPPPPLPKFPEAVFSDEQGGWHRVTYVTCLSLIVNIDISISHSLSDKLQYQTYHMQASKFTTVPFDAAAPAPIVVAEFFYRPRSEFVHAHSSLVVGTRLNFGRNQNI